MRDRAERGNGRSLPRENCTGGSNDAFRSMPWRHGDAGATWTSTRVTRRARHGRVREEIPSAVNVEQRNEFSR